MPTTVLTSQWGADTDSFDYFADDGSDWAGVTEFEGDFFPLRTVNRFDVSSIPSGASISKVELIVEVSATPNDVSARSWYIGPYNGDGQGDPETDGASTGFTRCDVSADNYGTTTAFRTTGVKTIDLGTAPASDLIAAISAASDFSVAIQMVGDTGISADSYSELAEYTDATNPPKLQVTFGPSPGVLAYHRRFLMGVS